MSSEDAGIDLAEDVTREFELSGHTNHRSSNQSRLIEFPGSRSSMPVWRKELAERVREAQERKAREASSGESETEGQSATPQLELLPQVESAPINPLVAAALKRIERAHIDTPSPVTASSRPLVAVAYAQSNYEPVVEPAAITQVAVLHEPETVESYAEPQLIEEPEARAVNLTVVPPVTLPAPEPVFETPLPARSRKIISDDSSNPALNYLDSVPTTLRVDRAIGSAGPFRRLSSGLLDLCLLMLFFAPIGLGLELLQGSWRNPQVIALALSALFIMGFVYFTVCTAFTGRTFGLRVLGLRIIDVRTGLIPTGGQSASRSFLYVLSVLSAGLLFLGLLFDSDHRTPHERFSRTAIITA